MPAMVSGWGLGRKGATKRRRGDQVAVILATGLERQGVWRPPELLQLTRLDVAHAHGAVVDYDGGAGQADRRGRCAHFRGMTSEPVRVEQLVQSRAGLLERVAGWLDQLSQAFLRSVEAEQPNFGLIDLHHALDLLGVRRKLQNLAQRSEAKRQADLLELEQALAWITGRAG